MLMLHHAQMTMQHQTLAIDTQRPFEVILCQIKLFLLKVNGTQSIPSIAMSRIHADGIAVAQYCLFEIFVGGVFVSAHRVCVYV